MFVSTIDIKRMFVSTIDINKSFARGTVENPIIKKMYELDLFPYLGF